MADAYGSTREDIRAMKYFAYAVVLIALLSGAMVLSQGRTDDVRTPDATRETKPDEPARAPDTQKPDADAQKRPTDDPGAGEQPAKKDADTAAPSDDAKKPDEPGKGPDTRTAEPEKKDATEHIIIDRKDRPEDHAPERPAEKKDRRDKTGDDAPSRTRRLGDEGKFIFGAYAGYGFVYPSGLIAGTGDQGADVTAGYAVGGELGYMLLEGGGLFLGVEYASKPISINRTYMRLSQQVQYQLAFIDYVLTYRGFFDAFDTRKSRLFAEIGMFYGSRSGRWVMRETMGSTTYERDMATLKPGKVQNEYGICFGFGVQFDAARDVSVNVGLRFEISLQNAFEYEDELKTNLGMLTLGACYKFDPF